MLTLKEIFKLTNYCVQYYLYNNYPKIYLTDNQWVDYLNNKININFFPPIKVSTCHIMMTRDNILSQLLLVSINYNIYRFKHILKSFNKGIDIVFSTNRLLYLNLIQLMLYNYKINENDYQPVNKINTLIINEKTLNSCLYHLSSLYNHEIKCFDRRMLEQQVPLSKFIISLLQHNINIGYSEYNSGMYIRDNNSIVNRKINSLLWTLYNRGLASNNIDNNLLYNLVQLDSKLLLHYTDYIDNIYNYLKIKTFQRKDILYIDQRILEYLYKYFNFSLQQKEHIKYFLDKINSLLLLNDL